LRLAYLVVPSDLVERTVAARRWMDGHTTALTQAVMADFMHDGHFGTHVRAMRQAYRDRRDALEQAVEKYARRHIRLGPRDGGMHAVGWLPKRTNVGMLAQRCARRGLYLRDLAAYYAAQPPDPGLVLNFASARPSAIARGIRVLSQELGSAECRMK
jgi:GntR family transcriptional regulator / MocR family aminotransferase